MMEPHLFLMAEVIAVDVPVNNVLRAVLSLCLIQRPMILIAVDMIVLKMEVGRRESILECIETLRSSML